MTTKGKIKQTQETSVTGTRSNPVLFERLVSTYYKAEPFVKVTTNHELEVNLEQKE